MRRAVASIAASAMLTATWPHAFVQTRIFGEVRPQGQPLELVLFDPFMTRIYSAPGGA